MRTQNKFLFKVLFGICTATLLLGGCNNSKTTTDNTDIVSFVKDENAIKKIQEGVDNLKKYSNNYVITTQTQHPLYTSELLTVVSGDRHYTEYSVDEEGNYGTLAYGSVENMTYDITDYDDGNGNYITLNTDEDGLHYYQLSKDYAALADNRKTLWVDYLLPHCTYCKEYSHTTFSILGKDVEMDLYECRVPSEYVQTLLGFGSKVLYEDIATHTEDANIKNYASYLQETAAFTLACSEGKFLVGVDTDGLLRYMGMEIGGIGTKAYITSVIVDTHFMEVREPLDITAAQPFETRLKEIADYCAKFTSVEEAIQAYSAEMSMYDEYLNDTSTETDNSTEVESSNVTDGE